MAARTLLRRLPSPVGFLLVAVCFLLPFVTLSCGSAQTPVEGRLTYTGVDLATGHVGTITLKSTPAAGDSTNSITFGSDVARPAPVQPFLIVAMVLTALGILTSLVPLAWWRALSGGAAAVLALIFLAGGQVNGMSAAREQARQDGVLLYGSSDSTGLVTATHIGYGFWLAVALLGALAVGSAVALIVHSRQKPADPAPQIPATVPEPP
jgi:hypothetical protein